jgi:hypothetical protein
MDKKIMDVQYKWINYEYELRPYWIRRYLGGLSRYDCVLVEQVKSGKYQFWFEGKAKMFEGPFRSAYPNYENHFSEFAFDSFKHAMRFLDAFLDRVSQMEAFL